MWVFLLYNYNINKKMIWIKNNTTNAIVIQASANINKCSEFVFEFVNEMTKNKTYFASPNQSSSISHFDLFELTEDSTIPQTKYTYNAPINLNNGQYTTYVYKCDELPNDDDELEQIINDNNNKIYSTKMVVDNDIKVASSIPNKYQ